ncbi:MAG: hypothetical protein IKB98_09765 [Clostridia bacterium]|nr:hypothetical protein [Clostridia bacterium]
MDEKVLEQLENVPSNAEDAFEDLTELCDSFAKLNGISEEEKKRLDYELDLIKKWGIAKVFLFGFHLILNDGFGVTYGVEGNSYVNYLLGVSTVNPVKYNLPFERLFNEHRKFLPTYNICVEKGRTGFLLKSLYKKFGKSKIIKSKEDNDNYFVSNRPINPEFISETRIVAKENEEAYEENISILSYRELTKLGYYNFSINEVKDIKYSFEEKFSEEEIYEKAKKDFSYLVNGATPFTDIDEVKKILVNTEYKLIYQEQLMEILYKLCDFDMAKSDFIRREIARAKKENLHQMQKILLEKYGENGQKLLDYLYKTGRYTVSKAYVIANLHNLIEY